MDLDDSSGLPEPERAALAAELAPLATLHQVILWGLPEHVVSAVVVQDEYSHDVVMPWRDGRFLVFDTT